MKRTIFLSLLLVLSLSLEAQTIVTDRPDQTESSITVPLGSIQIESGILVGFSDTNNGEVRELLLPSTLFRIALTKGLELRVLSQFESIKNKDFDKSFSGITDLEVGAKVQLFKKEDINTKIAFLSHIIIPSGSKDVTIDEFGTINKLSISHELSNTTGLAYNLGYDYFGIGKGNLTYSVALGIALTKKLGVYLEPYGALVELDKHEASFDAGVVYLIKENFQFDFSFGTGINHNMNYLSIGASINILEKKEKG